MRSLQNNKGFTLIELIAVLVIFGVLASVGAVKYERFSDGAIKTQFLRVARELNVRESLTYFDIRLEDTYIDDAKLFSAVDYNLGAAAKWSGLTRAGGDLRIKGVRQKLIRRESTEKKPAEWSF